MTTELLMAVRGRGADAETEPVTATIAGGRLRLELDDGVVVELGLDDVLALAADDDEALT